MQSVMLAYDDNECRLSGKVDFSNLMAVFNESVPHLYTYTDLIFDFSQLHSSHSAVIALMVEWMEFAKKHQKKIVFNHLPQGVLSIAKAAGLDQLL